MRAYDPNRPLISLHVPKCGGTSLRQVLTGLFKDKLYLHYFNEPKAILPPRLNFGTSFWRRTLLRHPYRGGVCIHGHFSWERGYGVQDYYPYVNQFITVVREPFELAVSDYFAAKKFGEERFVNGQRLPMVEHYQGFTDFFEREVQNRHSKILTHMSETLTLSNFEPVLAKRFVHIGVVEDLAGSVRRLADRLSLPPVKTPHANESTYDEAIAPGLREAFVRNHPLAYAIYEYALAHYKD